tara:strand:+ start:5606 stop:5983 length:378 start_codon:yes stop_codon:yes gene_type:complete
MADDLFEADSAKSLRDEGLLTVYQNAKPWFDAAFKALLEMRSDPCLPTFTGEDLRLQIRKKIGNPHHHNAWGALIMKAVRRGVIINTGKYVSMTAPSSHARRNPVYAWNKLVNHNSPLLPGIIET